MFLFENEKQEIDYLEIANLSHLEIREALHIFLGIKIFPSYFQLLPEEAPYFHREKIWHLRKIDVSDHSDEILKNYHSLLSGHSNEYLKQFNYWEELLLNHINRLLEHGVDPACHDIKSARPVCTQFPAPELKDQILYLWKIEHLLNWALSEGVVLPIELQTAFNISQIERKSYTFKYSEVAPLCIQALAQVLWYRNCHLSQPEIIEEMRQIIESTSFNKRKFAEYSILWSPLNFLISKEKNKYFKEEKQNILRSLLKDIDPRPNHIKKGRPKPVQEPKYYLPKIIPGVFSVDLLQTDFQKLKLAIQTLGYYLYGFGEIIDAETALFHPLISNYVRENEKEKQFAYRCLLDVCPPMEYLEIGRQMSKQTTSNQKDLKKILSQYT